MRATVLLFDIDGTLITTGGAGRRAMERAFAELHGRSDAVSFRLDGMTDRGIVRAALANIGVESDERAIDALLEHYLACLREEVRLVPDARYRVHAGMREAIGAARAEGGAIGLGTGNIRAGARIKRERGELDATFGFGGFGCDAEPRAELIRIGAERGAAVLGMPLASCRVVVIGDTPKDVAAAREIGAECIGVGTGRYSPKALLESGASWAFADLSAPGALDALLERNAGRARVGAPE